MAVDRIEIQDRGHSHLRVVPVAETSEPVRATISRPLQPSESLAGGTLENPAPWNKDKPEVSLASPRSHSLFQLRSFEARVGSRGRNIREVSRDGSVVEESYVDPDNLVEGWHALVGNAAVSDRDLNALSFRIRGVIDAGELHTQDPNNPDL